jgi:hypothetical protein
MKKPKVKPKKIKSAKLTADQIEIVGQFNDYSFENPKMTFEQTVQKQFGKNLFPRTPGGAKFKAECRKIFGRERRD